MIKRYRNSHKDQKYNHWDDNNNDSNNNDNDSANNNNNNNNNKNIEVINTENGEDGRANFMVDMTIECIPQTPGIKIGKTNLIYFVLLS